MLSKIFIFILGLAILGSALGLARYFMQNKPTAKKKTQIVKIAPVVRAIKLDVIDHQINIVAMGNVVAARKINLVSQVKGKIIASHPDFLPGGIVSKGETLVKINALDYELIAVQKNSDVVRAKNDLSIEMGKQSVAKKEYRLLGADLAIKDQELILRKPQLRLTKASLVSAEAKLKQAQLDVARTAIKAPFNALIESNSVNTGSWQSVGTNLASLIDINNYWVTISLPTDRLAFLQIPEFNSKNASKAVIKYPSAWGENTRAGKIKRLQPNIDSKIRMAKLTVEVNDPLSLKASNKNKPKLLLGSFVELHLAAKKLNHVVQIPRRAVRDGNKIWLIDNNKLNIVPIKPVWKNKNFVFIDAKSLDINKKLIISDLSSPIEAMKLKLQSETNE